VPFDLTFGQAVGSCRGVGKTADELLDELAVSAKRDSVPVPDLHFRSALPWALETLSTNGWIKSAFSKEKAAYVYVATDEEIADAAKDRSLDASIREAYSAELATRRGGS
jgi:hypothetical protein